MPESKLVLHRGGRVVTREELDRIDAPPATDTWFPLKHGFVLDSVVATLEAASFRIERTQLSVAREDARFFGTLDLSSPVSEGVTLAVGVRNSIDKSFPLGFCAGSRVFVCDNLSFRSELLVNRKHTRFGETRFAEAISLAVRSLTVFQEAEGYRIDRMRSFSISDTEAESLMLRSYEREIISHRALPAVIAAWRKPTHVDFEPRTHWSLMNAFTGAIQGRATSNPQQFALQTMQLNALLVPADEPLPDSEEEDVDEELGPRPANW